MSNFRARLRRLEARLGDNLGPLPEVFWIEVETPEQGQQSFEIESAISQGRAVVDWESLLPVPPNGVIRFDDYLGAIVYRAGTQR